MAGAAVLAVSITVFGDAVDPDVITEALGAAPDRSHRVGEAVSGESAARRRTGLWSISTHGSVPEESPLSDHMTALLGRVTTDATVWRGLAALHSTRIFIGWFMGDGNEALRVDASVLDELARRSLHLDIEAYAPAAEE
ncbi:MAG TPA: DUF4279 domain-containing protein [Candidatus Dormibacteraeota bacterium]|nr:DUF4279 domain-containing protein [Candidatus Dormibacteraeota bacterium]